MYSNCIISGNNNLDYLLSPDAKITKVGNNAINIDIPLGIPLGPSMSDYSHFSMTSLLTHTIAHSTRPSFRAQNQQPAP